MEPVSAALRRIGRALRPAEWVILGFVLYMARFDHTGMQALPLVPGAVIAAMLLVTAIRQLREFPKRAWPEGVQTVELYRTWAPRFALVLFALAAAAGALSRTDLTIQAGLLAGLLRAAFAIIKSALLPALPIAVVALGLGLHLKKHSAFVPRALAGEVFGEAGSMLRAWAPPSVMIFLYGLMSAALGNLTTADRDDALAHIDRALCLGHDPIHALEHLASQPLSEWMAFAYMGYLLFYPVGLGTLYVVARERFDEVVFALTLCLALGFIGYTLVPARGPMFTQHFGVSLDGYYLEGMKAAVMDRYRAPRDCFPSLHSAVAALFLIYARRFSRKLFWALFPVAASTPVACMYLRYHYLIDVIAGVALAFACAALARILYGLSPDSAGLPDPLKNQSASST